MGKPTTRRAEMMRMLAMILMTALVAGSHALYSDEDAVIELTSENFDREVLNDDGPWLVVFYASWCYYSKQMVSAYVEAAKALQADNVKVGAVNYDEQRELSSEYDIEGFPTIKIFGANKQEPTNYWGLRTAQGFINAGLAAANKPSQMRMRNAGDSEDDSEVLGSNKVCKVRRLRKDYWTVSCQPIEMTHLVIGERTERLPKMGESIVDKFTIEFDVPLTIKVRFIF